MTMKRLMISMALVALVVLTTAGRDRLYIKNFNIAAGNTIQVPVLLVNDTAYSGLQTDLYLPAGLSLDKEDDEYVIDLTERKDNSHTVSSNRLSNGAIRIFVSSASAREFSGSNGAIMTLSLTAAENFSGPAVIELKNSVCAEAIGTRHLLKDEVCHVNNGIVGDVNGDGEVNIADVNAVLECIISGKFVNSADVNGDGEINIADVNRVIDVILGH